MMRAPSQPVISAASPERRMMTSHRDDALSRRGAKSLLGAWAVLSLIVTVGFTGCSSPPLDPPPDSTKAMQIRKGLEKGKDDDAALSRNELRNC